MHDQPKYDGTTPFDYVNPRAPKGGLLRVAARQTTFDSLHPFIFKGIAAEGWRLSFEALTFRSQDEPFSLYGLIAKSIDMPADRQSVTFELRDGVRFADGEPVTVDDIVWTWKTLKDQGRPNHRLFYRQVTRVAVDGRRITFHFPGSDNRELPLLMALMPVLPKHYFAGRDFEATSLDPIPGTGPYQVDKLRVGESITWRRRDDYWGRDLPILQGHFNFDRIQYRYFRDKNTQFEAFKAGDHDVRFETDAGRWAREYTFPDVASGRVMLHQIPVKRPVGMKAMVFNTRRTLFTDARVREALGLALDFNFVNGNLLHGAFQRNTSFFQNSDLAARPGPAADGVRALLEPHLAELSPTVLDTPATPPVMTDRRARRRVLVQALKMLKSAGWKMGQDQVLERGDGQKLEFEILMYDPSDEAVAVNYAARLKRLGVRVSLRLVDAAQYERRRKNYDFDMIFNHWYQSLSPGSEQWYYWGRKQADTPATRNYAGVRLAAVDEMVSRMTMTETRSGLRNAARALDRILRSGHYVVPLYWLPTQWLATRQTVVMPETVPVYGPVMTTWWHAGPAAGE